MAEKILFLTGKLAEPSVHKVLQQMQPLPFDYRVHQLGVSVAALMTDKMIGRRLQPADYQDCFFTAVNTLYQKRTQSVR